MIAHVVTIVWRDDADAVLLDGLVEELTAFVATLDGIVSYDAGPNLRVKPNGADFGVVAVAVDEAALLGYLDDPRHLEIVARRMAPNVATRQAVQLEIGPRS